MGSELRIIDVGKDIEAAWNSGDLANTPEGIASNLSRCATDYWCGTRKCLAIFQKKSKRRRIGLTFSLLKTMMVPKV